MVDFLKQLKNRRKQLGLKQKDMLMRVGMSPQQYQRLEGKGNPRLDTLELLAKGLKGELMLIPREKLKAVKAALEGMEDGGDFDATANESKPSLADHPWKDILEDEG